MSDRTRGTLLLAAGAVVLAAAWLGPLPELARSSFTAHMGMHVLVVAVAAPLLGVGLTQRLGGTGQDPVTRMPWLFLAIPTSMIELVTIWTFHAPAVHHWARHSTAGMALEQSLFLLTAGLVWLAALGGSTERRRRQAVGGLFGLLLTSMHMTLLGALLAVSGRALYAAHGDTAGALADQQAGGVLMLGVGGASYLIGGLWLLRDVLAHGRGTARTGAVA